MWEPIRSVGGVNRLLKEIEAQLRAMDEARRAKVLQGVRSIVMGMLLLRETGLEISKLATSKAAGQLMIWAASETLPEILEHIKAQAKETGPHVESLFHSV